MDKGPNKKEILNRLKNSKSPKREQPSVNRRGFSKVFAGIATSLGVFSSQVESTQAVQDAEELSLRKLESLGDPYQSKSSVGRALTEHADGLILTLSQKGLIDSNEPRQLINSLEIVDPRDYKYDKESIVVIGSNHPEGPTARIQISKKLNNGKLGVISVLPDINQSRISIMNQDDPDKDQIITQKEQDGVTTLSTCSGGGCYSANICGGSLDGDLCGYYEIQCCNGCCDTILLEYVLCDSECDLLPPSCCDICYNCDCCS